MIVATGAAPSDRVTVSVPPSSPVLHTWPGGGLQTGLLQPLFGLAFYLFSNLFRLELSGLTGFLCLVQEQKKTHERNLSRSRPAPLSARLSQSSLVPMGLIPLPQSTLRRWGRATKSSGRHGRLYSFPVLNDILERDAPVASNRVTFRVRLYLIREVILLFLFLSSGPALLLGFLTRLVPAPPRERTKSLRWPRGIQQIIVCYLDHICESAPVASLEGRTQDHPLSREVRLPAGPLRGPL